MQRRPVAPREGDRLVRGEGRRGARCGLRAVARRKEGVDLAGAAGAALAVEEDRAVRRRGIGELGRGRAARRRLRLADQVDGAAGAEEMGDVEIAARRLAPELGRQQVAVALGEGAGHERGDLRVVPQREDLAAPPRIVDRQACRRTFAAMALASSPSPSFGPSVLHEPEPGLLDELEQSARRRAARPRLRIERRLPLRRRQEVVEAGAGLLGALPDGVDDRIDRRGLAGRRCREQEHRA